MKRIILFLLFMVSIQSNAQTRYFEFSTTCGHGNWQDSTFIAATSNQIVIDSVLANLSRPLDQRNFIAGPIGYGNGGHNHNADHLFLWHFIPNQWNLVQNAIEVCDGCPFTDVDANTTYWVGTVGLFCPWSSRPVREVFNPLGIEDSFFDFEISFFPNPAKNQLNLKYNGLNNISVSIINSIGQSLSTIMIVSDNTIIDISGLQGGLYFLKIDDGKKTGIKKFIIEGK